MSGELATPAQGKLVLPVTGEVIDLGDPEAVVRAGWALQDAAQKIRDIKSRVDEAARAHLAAVAATELQLGRFEVIQGTGKATYDWQAIYEAAIDAGIAQDAAERVVPLERTGNGKELNKLASRSDEWRRAAAAGTTRSGGSLRYGLHEAQAPAPETPKAIQQQVRQERQEAQEMDDLGI